MDIKAITKRLDTIQKIADRNKPCVVVVTFRDGRTTTLDPVGAIDLFREQGPFGDIVAFTPDRPEYEGLCGALSMLCHPVPNRRITDFE